MYKPNPNMKTKVFNINGMGGHVETLTIEPQRLSDIGCKTISEAKHKMALLAWIDNCEFGQFVDPSDLKRSGIWMMKDLERRFLVRWTGSGWLCIKQ